MCRGNVDAGVLSASEHPLHFPQPYSFHSSPLFLLVLGFVAIDSGSEPNGFWFLGQESLPGKAVEGKYMAQAWASGRRRGQGCVRSLSPLPGPCSVQESSLPTPGPRKPRPEPTPVGWDSDGAHGSLATLDHFSPNKPSDLVMPTWNAGITLP